MSIDTIVFYTLPQALGYNPFNVRISWGDVMRIKLLLLASCVLLILLAAPAFAAEIAGVNLPDKITIAKEPLLLNGAGIRKKFIIKIYVGGLYLPSKMHDASQAIAINAPKRIQMDFLYKKVSKQKMVDTWVDGFKANHSAQAYKSLEARIKTFCDMFGDAHRGDMYNFDYIPGKGTHVYFNKELKGVIAGLDFNQGLMRIWLGKHPADDGLKEGMLGL
jgi:hypothetical protein